MNDENIAQGELLETEPAPVMNINIVFNGNVDTVSISHTDIHDSKE